MLRKLSLFVTFCGPLSCPCPLDISAGSKAHTKAGEEQFVLASGTVLHWKSVAGQVHRWADQKRKVPCG